jgi:hypothetical protein
MTITVSVLFIVSLQAGQQFLQQGRGAGGPALAPGGEPEVLPPGTRVPGPVVTGGAGAGARVSGGRPPPVIYKS